MLFFDQYVDWFLNPNAVALGKVLAKAPVKRTVDEYYLNVGQQVMCSGPFVPAAMAAGPSSSALAVSTRLARTWPSVSVSTRRLRPLTSLPAATATATVAPVAVAAFLTLCVSSMTAVGQAFFRPTPGYSRSGRC